MSKYNETDVDEVIDLAKQLIAIVKDETQRDDVADKMVGRILAKLDFVIKRIDNEPNN